MLRRLFLLVVSLAALATTGCSISPGPFSDRTHLQPRVFVEHRPLWPDSDETITVTATADVAGGGITELKVTLITPEEGILEQTCAGSPCTLTAAGPHGTGPGVYSARLTVGGTEVGTPSGYAFQIGSTSDRLVDLRVPFSLVEGVSAEAFRIVLVRDCGPPRAGGGPGSCPLPPADYSRDELLSDAESFLYGQVLVDPAYRWRDNQLAFRYYTDNGRVTDRSSGLTSRCGADPWPTFQTTLRLPTELDTHAPDVLGVIHRHDTPADFRDCAGRHVQDATIATFSADGREAEVVHHELGHALFGLGDEYWEPESSRTVAGGGAPSGECRCRVPGSGTTAPGEVCFGDDLIYDQNGIFIGCASLAIPPAGSLQDCGWAIFPPSCYPAPELCPPLSGSCENLFASLADCETARTDALADDAVESKLGACRQLCGSDETPCPCEQGPLFKLDQRNPPGAPDEHDIMGATEGSAAPGVGVFHGPACARCMEQSYCERWEGRVRGGTASEVEAACGSL